MRGVLQKFRNEGTKMPLPQAEKIRPDDPGSHLDLDGFSRICKALGHPARMKIVQYLKKINHCVCQEIVDVLPLSQSTVSQHLKILKDAGVIQGEVEGPRTCYCLNPEIIAQYKKMAQTL
jgi:ArsR family transcriptional regulator